MALLRRDFSLFGRYVAFGLVSVAVTFVNPVGAAVYEGVLGTVGHFALDHITEWMPFFRIVGYPECLPLCLYALVFAALELANIRARPIEARLLSWAFLIAGIWKLRYLSLFLVFSTVPLALHLDHLLPRVFARRVNDRHLGLAGAALLCCLPLLCWRSVPPNPGLLPQIYPRAEIDWLIAHPPHAHLLNHWNYGGFLIFRTRGAIPVFVDGRSATAYPDSLLHDYFPLMNLQVDPATWQRVLAKYRIDTIMWPKAHTALQDYLTGSGWQLAYSGPIANIYVKPP
jgi:hypothetical protein